MHDRKSASGPEAYPYDPNLRLESQRGLDRLRCIADRALAANLFVLFEAAERNTAAATDAARELELRRRKEVQFLQTLAARALEGGLGEPPMQLAEALDEAGVPTADERVLREFALALRQLGHSQ